MVPGGQRVGLQGPRGSWGSLQCPKGSSVLGVLLVQGVQMVQLVQVVQVVQVVRVAHEKAKCIDKDVFKIFLQPDWLLDIG